jgi:hypothetical protein
VRRQVSRRTFGLLLGVFHFADFLIWCAVLFGHCILPCSRTTNGQPRQFRTLAPPMVDTDDLGNVTVRELFAGAVNKSGELTRVDEQYFTAPRACRRYSDGTDGDMAVAMQTPCRSRVNRYTFPMSARRPLVPR